MDVEAMLPTRIMKALFSSTMFLHFLFQFQCQQSLGLIVPGVKSTTSNTPKVNNVMALDKFLGKWLENKKEGFQYLADALGLTGEQRAFFENSQSELSFARTGDTWTIQVGIVGVPQNTKFSFKLGETYNSQNIDGSPLKSVIRQDGDRLAERHESVGQRHFIMDITREISGDTMNATTTIGGVSMQTIYKRS